MKNYDLSVYAEYVGPRLRYMLDTLCAWTGWRWSVGREDAATDLALYYSKNQAAGTRGVHLRPSGYLESSEISVSANWMEYRGVPCPQGRDPIAGAFYLLTCAEEYGIQERDAHQRVPASALTVVQRRQHRVPLADRLLEQLALALCEAAGLPPAAFLAEYGRSTLDLDAPFLLRQHSVAKQVKALGRAVLSGSVADTFGILRSGSGLWPDPFDTWNFLEDAHCSRDLRPLLFVLMGYGNREDPSILVDSEFWQHYLRSLSWLDCALHPSYYSGEKYARLQKEKARLEALLGKRVSQSRQHFLRIVWPTTFRQLLDAGIEEDHSLMWPDLLGFRCGTARSFYWYDLADDRATNLKLVPPAFMEVTARNYEGLSPEAAVEAAEELAREAAHSQSGLRIIWHNSNLGPLYGWAPWRSAYLKILDLIQE